MNLTKNKNNRRNKKAFTLIELLVVIAVVTFLFGIGLGGLLTSQRQVRLISSYESVLQIVRDTRSLALAGKAQPDYTDYDRDSLSATTSPKDLVVPANYGISFDVAGTITTFADLHNGLLDTSQQEGTYVPPPNPTIFYTYTLGKDVTMSQYKLDSRLQLISNVFKISAPAVSRVDIFYSPIFGDLTINPSLSSITPTPLFFIFGVGDSGANRKKCSKIHPISGVPEPATDAQCANQS